MTIENITVVENINSTNKGKYLLEDADCSLWNRKDVKNSK